MKTMLQNLKKGEMLSELLGKLNYLIMVQVFIAIKVEELDCKMLKFIWVPNMEIYTVYTLQQ